MHICILGILGKDLQVCFIITTFQMGISGLLQCLPCYFPASQFRRNNTVIYINGFKNKILLTQNKSMISIKLHRNLTEMSTRQRSQTAHLPSLPASEHRAGVAPAQKGRCGQSPLCSMQVETSASASLGFCFLRYIIEEVGQMAYKRPCK